HPEYSSLLVEPVLSGTVDFALEPAPGVISVIAVDAKTGAPLAGVDVAVRVADGTDLAASLYTDPEGIAWIPDLAPMGYKVTARITGYAPKTAELYVGPNTSQTLPFRMGLGMQGTVVATISRRPIQYAWISVYRL